MEARFVLIPKSAHVLLYSHDMKLSEETKITFSLQTLQGTGLSGILKSGNLFPTRYLMDEAATRKHRRVGGKHIQQLVRGCALWVC